jgi:hypothetical protein
MHELLVCFRFIFLVEIVGRKRECVVWVINGEEEEAMAAVGGCRWLFG